VKGMSATQNSPGRIVIVQTFVFRGVAGKECRMTAARLNRSPCVSGGDCHEPMTGAHAVNDAGRQREPFAGAQFNFEGQRKLFRHSRLFPKKARLLPTISSKSLRMNGALPAKIPCRARKTVGRSHGFLKRSKNRSS
jgi:hypothetical protein